MSEKPIIFSTESVKAILENRKTQTRRVLTECKKHQGKLCRANGSSHTALSIPESGKWIWHPTGNLTKEVTTDVIQGFCPFGKIGDQLWVRETFMEKVDVGLGHNFYKYKATPDNWSFAPNLGDQTWKPSIFMPRAASRITLEITNIRVERLQDISEEDLEAEGFYESHYYCDERVGHVCTSPRDLFLNRWDLINEKRGFSWQSNPFVFVLEFKMLEKSK